MLRPGTGDEDGSIDQQLSVSRSYKSGMAAASDATCDGLDDDCSGTADEDFAQETTTCTVNGCSAHGATACSSGQVIDTCTSAPTCFAELDCTDTTDNDNDSQVDCADSDCAAAPSCQSPVEICGNSLDDDGDGLPDCADIDCVSQSPCNNIPPIAADVAPALDLTVQSRNIDSLQFLIGGPTPIQVGVAPGTLVSAQAALVTGRVLTEGGAPLSAVLVDVAHHPEFGLTYTDANGEFHMAVNGGGLLTLRYSLSGYAPAQRQVQTHWGQGGTADDVILLVRSHEVTKVDVSGTASNPQMVVGPVETDASGTRRATLVIPAGTAAQVYDAAGNVTSLPQLSLRLTEHTVGEHGPERMPAPLPPTSAYTYAIDITADEAQHKVNGIHIELSQPIPFYVDNFLGMPIGTSVPTGFYDEDINEWEAVDSGLVLKILGEQAGLATIDSNGDNIAESPATLAALAIDDAERAVLATRYEPGDSFWRVRLSHFCSYDMNFGLVPDGSTYPPPPTSSPQVPPQDPHAPPCTMSGNSSVTCFRQVLDEEVAITGSEHALHYTSERVPGRTDNRSVSFPLQTANFSTLPVREVQVTITPPVGKKQTFEWTKAEAPASFTWTWDGLDAFGRRLIGRYPVDVQVTYAYGCTYSTPSRFGFRDGAVLPASGGGGGIGDSLAVLHDDGSVARGCRGPLRNQATLFLESWDAKQSGLGGWELAEHHTFHPDSGELMLGNGTRQVGGDTPSMTRVAGPFPGNASGFRDTAIAPDGTLYLLTGGAIYRKLPNSAETVLLNFSVCSTSDPYVDRVCVPVAIAVDRAGQLIVVDQIINTTVSRVLKVNPQTLAVKRIAGGPGGFSGDGGPALDARFNTLGDVAIQDDGSLLLLDTNNGAIRRMQEGGYVERVVGTGT
ncbi:MAG TPA: hypothetical protein VFN67_11195, partial [Polyangiales bacterium]|nr:hypothetical protein [Polyangiales bacterium]